ncbi:Alkaline phosphatase synthesis sensor protein PhoR [compost metagenome]
MRFFFERFGKFILFTLTILIVMAFQSYWLWNNFQNYKTEILDQTKLKVQQILMNDLIFDRTYENNEIMDNDVKAKISEKLSEVMSIKDLATVNAEVFFYGPNDEILYSNNDKTVAKVDSLIYYKLKPILQKTYNNPDITIYTENEKLKKTYPNGRTIKIENTTDPINDLSQNTETFRVHIENLSFIIISKMYDVIFFSIAYLMLFLGTIFLLLNNIKINRKLLKNKDIFTRNVTHELKIPISTIMIAAEGFEKYNIIDEPEAAKKYISTIKRAGSQLSFFVESILQHTKAANGNSEVANESINLLALLEEVKSILSAIIIEKEANIIFKDISDKTFIKGNYDQMRQVFINLFDNAIKYSERKPDIIVYGEKIIDRMIIKIHDNGIGISKKHTEEIFEPYFRVTNDDVYNVKGFGIGLSFVRSALKNQNGKIHVSQSDANGTIIELNLAAYV